MNRYDDDDIPLTDADYDGVIYEPSSQSLQETQHLKKTESKKVLPKKTKKINQKSQYKIFMTATIISGIIISVVAFAVVYNSFSPNHGSSSSSVNNTEELAALKPNKNNSSEIKTEEDDENDKNLGVIKEIDAVKKTLTLSSLDDGFAYVLEVTGKTELKDKYDNSISLQEFKIGDIADFVYNKDKEITYLKLNAAAWTEEDVTGVKIDSENSLIEAGDKSYSYSELLNVTFKGTQSDISKIDELDTITMKGYNNTVYSISIEKGHSIIQISNKDKIKDGTFEVDNNIYKALSEVGSVKVKEGSHKIIVKGSNCEPFTKEIITSADETVNLDLSEVHIKTGVLLIKANVSDYLLTINDMPELSREPLVLEYGAYSIKLEKEGYTSFETQLILNSDQKTVNAELQKEVKMSKITVNTNPDGAEVYIDNAKVGYTPVSLQITQGKHNITVNKDGYNESVYSGVDITLTKKASQSSNEESNNNEASSSEETTDS